ncbi:centrobin [Biomphalaria pfeifferi]|uniref:Centrobin n=1 Tax=Biomphalaria pfeifferi TaxID=112525 RepID=A0AAD8C553_BIOPF|nr:centrobin [Biomphalaria pfeifferi]
MDGQAVNSGEQNDSCFDNLHERETGSETNSVEADLEHMHLIEDDFEQPDGQRSSLSLDDDGGTHFDLHSQDGVMRRGSTLREVNISPSPQGVSDDNDIIFNPLQRLHFDDDDFVDEDEDDNCQTRGDDNGIDEGVEITGHGLDDDSLEDRDYLHFRPAVHGSELAEQGAYGGVMSTHDQGQNIRIIEGHDSSLLDDAANSYGFNFLHTQMIQIPVLSPVNVTAANSSRLEDDAHNLYDSLEREDGSNQYSNSNEPNVHVLENNTSEYYSSGSLMAANSQGPDNDLLWAQDESSENGNYLTHSQQHYQKSSEHQSPPRNFQADSSGIFVAKRAGTSHINEGTLGGFGDSHIKEQDNTDALSIELSEEGLLQNTQTYAQPISSMATSNGAVHLLQAQKDWNLWPQSNTVQASGFDLSDPFRTMNVQPKNLTRSQGLCNLNSDANSEGDGEDTQDKRQAGAGSSLSTSDQNQSAVDSVKVQKKSVGTQPRRPAVQGSASSGDTRKTSLLNQRSNLQNSSTSLKKSSSFSKSSSLGDKSSKGKGAGADKKNHLESSKGGSTGLSNVSSHSRPAQNSVLVNSQNASSSLHSSVNSTKSRVSGVGKESYLAAASSSFTRAANQLSSSTDVNYVSLLSQRENSHTEPSNSSELSNSASIQPQLQNPHISNSFDRMRPSASQIQSELRSSQSFNKQYSASGSVNGSSQNLSVVSDHAVESNLHHLPPRPTDTRRMIPSINSNVQGGHQHNIAPHHFSVPSQQTSFFGFGSSIQHTKSGFPIQAPINLRENVSLENSHHYQNKSIMEGFNSHNKPVMEGYNSSNKPVMDGFKAQNNKSGPTQSSLPASQQGHADPNIQGMEEVRSQLLNVLLMGADSANASVADHTSFDHSDTMSEILTMDQQVKRQLHFDTDISSFMGSSQDDMSEILENFPTFSSKIFLEMSGGAHKNETSVHSENQYLRDSLEKEKYRRKHCEEHIQKLNAKLLEVQQQLAVAISTDKRKDLMIEQLDRQLAKVVEGWKKRELEKDEFLKVLTHEKVQIEETLQSQQNMINSFERELALTVEQLRAEKEQSNQIINDLKEKLKDSREEKEHAVEALETEQEKFAGMMAEWKELTDNRDRAEQKAKQSQERLLEEQELSAKKEQEFLAKINEVKEANQKVINMEKIKLEEQKKKLEEVVLERDELKTELKKAALDLEQLIRDKESQKVEVAIMEAKFETAQRKLEADLHVQMEKEIAEQASEFHTRIETALEEAAERHRKQISELQSQHQRDIERQTAMMNEDRLKREDEHHKQISDIEEKLQALRSENHNLRQSKIKLESQRVEILTKLQFMMQSQWNEAVSLLVSTPQKKSLNSSFMSSQAGSGHSGHLGAVMAVSDSNTSIANLNLTTSVPASSIAQGTESRTGETTNTSLSESHIVKSVEIEGKDRGEELNRMNRVEEYLQQLNHHMEIPMTKNDLQISDGNRSPDVSGHSSTTPSGQVNHSYSASSSEHLQRQPQQKDHMPKPAMFGSSMEFLEREHEYLNKPSNNLNQSHFPRVHGYVTGQAGKTLITTTVGPGMVEPMYGGQGLVQEFTYQALPMRSPQQSSSRFNLDLSHQSLRSDTESDKHQFVIANGPYTPPQQHLYSMSFQPQHECLKQLSSPLPASRHPQGALFPGRQHAGDCGDQRSLKQTSSIAGDKNVFSPESPRCNSSPAAAHNDHWSPGNAASARPFYINNAGSTIPVSPEGRSMIRSIEGMESPVKKHKPRPGQPSRTLGSLNDSLSPPVKQTADRLECDVISDAESSAHDPDRMPTNYSQLLESFEEQQNRQSELQHYVRMLLQKAPGSVYSEPERDFHFDPDVIESSRDITVDFDMNETATALELTSQLTRFQQLREGQTFKTIESHNDRVVQSHDKSQSQEVVGHMNELIGENGVISSQGLSEISQLLSLYRNQLQSNSTSAGQANVASQLMHVLKDVAASNSDNFDTRSETRTQSCKNQNAVRKVKPLSKTKKVRIACQSADTSLNSESRDKLVVGPPRPANPVPTTKKSTQVPMELNKDKKPGPPKPTAGSKGGSSSGGAAWK